MLDIDYLSEIQNPFSELDQEVPPVISSVRWSHSQSNALFHEKLESAKDKIPEILPPLVAAAWPAGHKVDIRPRVTDKISKQKCLVDSGSAITAIAAGPDDIVNPSLALAAANGSLIECCGYKTVTFRFGRKSYEIKAAIAKIEDTILGWDFIKKHKLSFKWEGEDCFLWDRKANAKQLLEFATYPLQNRPHLHSIQAIPSRASENADFIFSMAAMAELGNDPVAPEKVPDEYRKLLDKYPALLETSFKAKSNGKTVIHYIHTKGKPCSAKLRPLMKGSPKEVKGKENWQELVDLGIVEPVDVNKPTLWTSALHLQPKKCGNFRCCSDFRALNNQTELDHFPLPHLQKFTHQLHGSKVFTKLDIRKAYHHLEVAKEHRHKTATITPWGCFQYVKMPMGLRNASQSYQRYMSSVLQGLDNVYCYLDDVLIHTKTEAEHDHAVEEVFKRLSDAGLSLSLDKCQFAKSSLEFLGYIVDHKGITPLPKKTEAISKFPEPSKQKELLGFLGSLNYFRHCLGKLKKPGHPDRLAAEVLAPLYQNSHGSHAEAIQI